MSQSSVKVEKAGPTVPTPEAMSVFASFYSKTQWAKLCKNQEFIDIFTNDLSAAKKLADKILT